VNDLPYKVGDTVLVHQPCTGKERKGRVFTDGDYDCVRYSDGSKGWDYMFNVGFIKVVTCDAPVEVSPVAPATIERMVGARLTKFAFQRWGNEVTIHIAGDDDEWLAGEAITLTEFNEVHRILNEEASK
jgi:hypothetical protein